MGTHEGQCHCWAWSIGFLAPMVWTKTAKAALLAVFGQTLWSCPWHRKCCQQIQRKPTDVSRLPEERRGGEQIWRDEEWRAENKGKTVTSKSVQSCKCKLKKFLSEDERETGAKVENKKEESYGWNDEHLRISSSWLKGGNKRQKIWTSKPRGKNIATIERGYRERMKEGFSFTSKAQLY